MIEGSHSIKRLLAAMAQLDASDLHIKVGLPPIYRVGGHLKKVNTDPLTEDEADHLLDPLLDEAQRERFNANGALDFAAHLDAGDRFRVNMFLAGGHVHAAIRRVKAEIPTYASLHLPPIYSRIVEQTAEGLVIVCGVTGSGKSTTLAAMIDHVNTIRDVNIITIEDPVEFRFTPKKAIVSQREMGIDVHNFADAMRSAVRQDPDVIFIGEMRDKPTMLTAIQAAETGHLVFATLHTADTMQAFGRILEFFPPEERQFIRMSLSNSLRAICAQRLLPALEDFETSTVPATEVLLMNPSVREAIREGHDEDLPAILNGSKDEGMRSFTDSLVELVESEATNKSTAMDYAPNREALESRLKGVEVKASGMVGRIRNRG
ncbi:MAG: PilT/PilU family type 4a pilus ATPase [Phycisphaera sp.]|nr:MAG: PilT/PilU family type 4a pilus ATPase [Phycisphaera sp.]